MIGRERALALVRAGLAASRGDYTLLSLCARDAAHTGLRENEIHQNWTASQAIVIARVAKDGHEGRAWTSDVTLPGLKVLVERAYQRASSGQAPAIGAPGTLPGTAGASTRSHGATYKALSQATARQVAAGPRERADDLATVAARARHKGFSAAGGYSASALEIAVAGSVWRGPDGVNVDGYHAATRVGVWAEVSGEGALGGRGYAAAYAQDMRDIDITVLAEQAMARCLAAHGRPVALDAGRYEVVLEPAAVADLLAAPAFRLAFGPVPRDCGSSGPTAVCPGQTVASPAVTLMDDPADPWGAPQPFDFEGGAKAPLVLIQNGVTHHAVFDRAAARRNGTVSTGHSTPKPGGPPAPWHLTLLPSSGAPGPALHTRAGVGTPVSPPELLLSPGTAGLVSKVDRGLLVSRSGCFLIEGGRAVRPAAPMRLAAGPWDVLARVLEVGPVAELILEPVEDGNDQLFLASSYGGGRFPAVLASGIPFQPLL